VTWFCVILTAYISIFSVPVFILLFHICTGIFKFAFYIRFKYILSEVGVTVYTAIYLTPNSVSNDSSEGSAVSDKVAN
jgi:hypothetical protein